MYRAESRYVLATLIRLVGDFDRAEEAMQDAFAAAVEQWPRIGVPANPRAWLISAGRFRAIDALRRKARFDKSAANLAKLEAVEPPEIEQAAVADDRLRLIFTCCHPALPADARVALTLREVCGLTTEEIARAFLIKVSAVAKRIVRAKVKIRVARIPYEVPCRSDLAERLDSVLQVVYLIFTEGYAATTGSQLIRSDLSLEAIRLGRMLLEISPEPEVEGVLALMLLQESRRNARATSEGDVILLDDQDRSLWNRDLIAEGNRLLERSFRSPPGPYTLQAAIAAVHAEAPNAAATDWTQIVGLYDLLIQCAPSPVIELNRAVAIAMRDTPWSGLKAVDAILARGELQEYYLLHSVRADLFRRMGMTQEARSSYEKALSLTQLEPVRRFLERRLHELPGSQREG